ncbi:hypothetical protein BX600DRAFT_374438 [Xylariales sp. PMI_506]|nr:hypothetical protein BX600DRAFT_374438 [Xylariales sp. PMI_506]
MDRLQVRDTSKTRLHALAEEWGLFPSPLPSPLLRPDEAPSAITPADDAQAEELLRQQRLADEAQHSKTGISKAFTSKKKGWEYKEIYSTLVNYVAERGSPAVAEALVLKLKLVGGNVNLAQKSRTSLLSRRKSLDLAERSQVLQKAVENRQQEMVEVLLPYADALSLDTALPIAIRNQDTGIVELLIRYGASSVQMAEGQDAFRQACSLGDNADIISMILASEGRPPVSWVSQSMVEAARAGCLETVRVLSQSTADGNYDGAAALKTAINLGRRDIVLTLCLGSKPPRQPGLNEAFEQLMKQQNVNPNEKMAMAEILLCAGANGDIVAEALLQACATHFIEMIRLLVAYSASIEYQDGLAIRRAISKGKLDLVEVLLQGTSPFNSVYASECVELLPKKMRFEDRHMCLSLLLRKGANGPPLDEALVDATEVGDVESAKLLLNPLFPGGTIVGTPNIKKGPRSMVFERHEIASTDHKGALALQIAVKTNNVAIARIILSSKPPMNNAMAQIFPSVRNLPRLERYQVTEAFLATGLSGPCVHSALQNAIDEKTPQRDERLIALLLRHNADVNFNEGAAITAAIAQQDLGLLQRLLNSKPTPQIAAKAVPRAMEAQDPAIRSQMLTMLLGAGAAQGGPEVSAALATLLKEDIVDGQLITSLLQKGKVDINADGGVAIVNAARNSDPTVLETVLASSQPSPQAVDNAIKGLGKLPPSPDKAGKLDVLLRRTTSKDALGHLLIDEVQIMLKTPAPQRVPLILKTLLANGADVNCKNGEALQRAVAAADESIAELLFSANPTPHSLSFAMPNALRIKDPMDRLTFAQRILKGGIPASEVNRALVFAVNTYPDDMPLINTLLSYADTKDGLALIEAIKLEKQDLVELILTKKRFSLDVLNQGFEQATKWKNKRSRSLSCNNLLKAGANGEVVSNALLTAASDGDVDFGKILVRNGGSIEYNNGQAVIEACRSGASDVLRMLLSGDTKVSAQTLQRGFQAAIELSDLKKRAEVFDLLLEHGFSGEIVDAQLVSAVRFGDAGEELVGLLLRHGASPDFNEGEAVEKATMSAFLGSLKMLLGITEVGGKQKKPSSHTLLKAMNICWDLSRDTRFAVLESIFENGRPPPNAVHAALTRVVGEEDPEERLIELLVTNRASPTANGCQTLVDATRTLSLSQFEKLLESRITPEEASLAFSKAFVPESAKSWVSDRGFGIARALLKKGARGEGIGSAFVAVLGVYAESPGEVSNRFVELLLKYGADVNHNHGEALQNAAAQGHIELLRRLLQEKPSSEAITLAFARIFDATAEEGEVEDIINLFAEYREGGNQMDVMFVDPGSEPVMIRALAQFPRSTKILQALLDVGYYHDQMTTAKVMPEVLDRDEQVNLLSWALLQPQKKISSAVIKLLIERGAKVNYETRETRVTPVMLAIRARRPDLVKALLLAGAEVDIADATGRSPLSMASAVGGDLSITMMSNLLAVGASRNDGSLHNAARELNLEAMQILVEYKHDPDFPSPQHDGRSALGELCLHAADSGEITAVREKAMEKAINFLLDDSDITLHSDGKSVLLLALESADPVTTTKVLLRADMWKYINKPFNYYSDGTCTYSPTQYVSRILPQTDVTPDLIKLLKANRCADIYYANHGPQPDDAVGMPSSIQQEEQDRKARLARQMKEDEAHNLAIARSKELAAVQAQIWANQAELEDARKKRAHGDDLSALQERAQLEEELFASALAQQRARQSQEVAHQQALTAASRRRVQDVGDAELALETARQQRRLEWERDLGSERVGNANQLSSIRLREREELERMDKASDGRFKDRLREQKKLVDSQNHLAANLAAAPGAAGAAGRRQIGYVTGELD